MGDKFCQLYLYHLIFSPLARRPERNIIPRHSDHALYTTSVRKDGDLVENQISDSDAPPETVSHVGGDPVAVDGKGGEHGGALGGRDLEEVGDGEVSEAGYF